MTKHLGTIIAAGLGCFCLSPSHAAHIAKFDTQAADVAYVSKANVYDIERCLIRLEGAGGVPHVYSQPDRLAERMIVWINDNNDASARVDLAGASVGTKIRAWRAVNKNPAEFEICAPH